MPSMLAQLIGNIFKESGFEIERYAQLKHFKFSADFRTAPVDNFYVIPPNKKYFLLYATLHAFATGTTLSIVDDAHGMMWGISHQGKQLADGEVLAGSSGDNVNRLLVMETDSDLKFFTTASANYVSLQSRVPILQTIEGGQFKIRTETNFPGGNTVNQWTYRISVAALLLKNAY